MNIYLVFAIFLAIGLIGTHLSAKIFTIQTLREDDPGGKIRECILKQPLAYPVKINCAVDDSDQPEKAHYRVDRSDKKITILRVYPGLRMIHCSSELQEIARDIAKEFPSRNRLDGNPEIIVS